MMFLAGVPTRRVMTTFGRYCSTRSPKSALVSLCAATIGRLGPRIEGVVATLRQIGQLLSSFRIPEQPREGALPTPGYHRGGVNASAASGRR